jgi:hypothetical protein
MLEMMPNHRCRPRFGNIDRTFCRLLLSRAALLTVVLVVLSVSSATAAQVVLAWDPNREEDLAGYRVYWGTESRVYPFSADIGDQTSHTASNLTEGRVYFFAVTAYDVHQQESDYSAELVYAVPVTDTDQDGISDADELEHYRTDPNNADTDGDTIPDGWEVAAGSDPLVDDAGGDVDGDGLTNREEYIAYLQSGNHAPYRPFSAAPINGHTDVQLAPVLQTGSFLDPDTGDYHLFTHWQISRRSDFRELVFELQSDVYLTSLPLPVSLLDGSTTYYWRTKYTDSRLADSVWSPLARFSTVDAAVADSDGNGIPDVQEIAAPVDLDQNGIPDQTQADIKCLHAAAGDVQIGIQSQTDGATIEKVESLPMSLQLQSSAGDMSFPLGLISFRIHAPTPGDTVAVRVLYSQPIPSGGWFKHTPSEGWMDYSPQVTISSDRQALTFFLTDGGDDDADGIANGVIVDPAGLATGAGTSSIAAADAGGAGCFIGTVSGSPSAFRLKKP